MNLAGWAEIALTLVVTVAAGLARWALYLARVWAGRAHLARPGAEARRAAGLRRLRRQARAGARPGSPMPMSFLRLHGARASCFST